MERITFINSRGQSIQLGNDGPFILTKIEGTGAVNVDIQTSKSPYQDGVSYHGNTLEPRLLSIEVMLLAETMEEMINHRRTISRVFNPKLSEGTLIYEIGNIRREIKAISELAPVFPESEDIRTFKEYMQPGLIQLYCPSPFWLDDFEASEEIITWIGGMTFPLRLPTAFSMAGEKAINIINNGDVGAPVTIKITGTATNPKITNNTIGEYIKINRTLTIDDTLVITTAFGDKRVELNGDNVFHYIDMGSTFFNLEIGDNLIELQTDEVSDTANIELSYRNRYIGI